MCTILRQIKMMAKKYVAHENRLLILPVLPYTMLNVNVVEC